MELLSIAAFAKLIPLAFAVAFLVQALKDKTALGDWFYGPRLGKVTLLFLPFILGLAGATVLHFTGFLPEFLISGFCAGGLSSLAYDVTQKAKKKVEPEEEKKAE